MAARSKRNADANAIRFNFRLNPRRPKERVILEFLRDHAENYDASRIIKQALYEMATGRSWVTDQPLRTAIVTGDAEEPALAPIQQVRQDHLLDEMLQGLEDWMR